nr:DPP IV N-terminal domain-containing protein [Sphingomonas colocasiae]
MIAALGCSPATAQERPDLAPAERFTFDRITGTVANADIVTHWIAGKDSLWYKRTDANGDKAFVLVDAASGRAKPAFDHALLARGLSATLQRPVAANALPFDDFRYSADGKSLAIDVGGKRLRCAIVKGTCDTLPSAAGESVSPDGRWIAFVRDHNLWVRPADGGEAFALTTDGIRDHAYAGTSGDTMSAVTQQRSGVPGMPAVLWSPDSSKLATQWIDEREVGEYHLVESIPADGSLRPRLYSYRYPLPGDKAVATARIVMFDLATRKRTDVAAEPLIAAYWNPIQGGQLWWSKDGQQLYFLNRDRFYREVGLNVADSGTGESRRILSEKGDTNLTINWFREKPLARTLANGDVIWFSERSGWAHLYYYRKDGTLRNPITSGAWLVRNVLAVDEAAQRVFFSGLARDPARQPYDQYVYSVKFDGSDLRLLTPEDADHVQMEPSVSVGANRAVSADPAELPARATFSASGRYFVDSFSRPDLAPRLVLRRADGTLVRMLETADGGKAFRTGAPLPEPFSTLAADGRTRLYGTMFKPSDFDPAKRYAVVELNYPGPQSVINSRYFTSAFSNRIGTQDRQALAELGFIVITMDGRGGPFRSKAFWNESYGRMGTAGTLEDHVVSLKQLAGSRPWMDLDRVGIFGHSGGGYASVQAILTYPDVYKVAVAGAGDHDQRIYQAMWSDLYNGPDLKGLDATVTPDLAARLKGKLLLVHGEMDDNVHPASTMRLADALMKADKDFDMLIVPGTNHLLVDPGNPSDTVTRYLQHKRWAYFVEHLGGPKTSE